MVSRKKPNDHDRHMDAQISAGELFIKKLKSETSKCGVSTGSAIFEAQEPSEKRRALDAGIDEWNKALCAAADEYYSTCFELGRKSKADLDGKQPADFAYGLTARALSIFLRVSALDGAEENSDGRVRQFIRDVCGPPDVDVDNLPDLSLDPAPSQAFRLPSWAAKHTFGDRIARKPKPPSTGTLSTEQTESVILAKQTMLTSGLLEALLDAYRKALVTVGMGPSASATQEAPIVLTPNAAPPGEPTQPSAKRHEFWRDRTTGTWTICLPHISLNPVPLRKPDSVVIGYLWAVYKAGMEGIDAPAIQYAAGTGMGSKAAIQGDAAADELSSGQSYQPMTDPRYVREMNRKIKEWDKKAREATEEGRPDDAIELKEEAMRVRKLRNKTTRPFKKGSRALPSDNSRAVDTVKKGIDRALNAISLGSPQVGAYLRSNIQLDGGHWYAKVDTSEWRFISPSKPREE